MQGKILTLSVVNGYPLRNVDGIATVLRTCLSNEDVVVVRKRRSGDLVYNVSVEFKSVQAALDAQPIIDAALQDETNGLAGVRATAVHRYVDIMYSMDGFLGKGLALAVFKQRNSAVRVCTVLGDNAQKGGNDAAMMTDEKGHRNYHVGKELPESHINLVDDGEGKRLFNVEATHLVLKKLLDEVSQPGVNACEYGVLSDFDDTLAVSGALGEGEMPKIDSRILDILNRLQEKGVVVEICTARGADLLKSPSFQELEYKTVTVSLLNGTYFISRGALLSCQRGDGTYDFSSIIGRYIKEEWSVL